MDDHYKISIESNTLPAHGELSVLFAGEGKPFPNHRIGPSVHNYYLVHTVISGRGVFEIHGTRYECSKGDTFFIFPDVLFSYIADAHDPWSYRWVAFKGHMAEPLLLTMGITPLNPVIHSDDLRPLRDLYKRMKVTLERAPYPELADLEASGLLRIMFKEYGVCNAGKLTFNSLAIVPDIERQIKQAVRWLSFQYAQQISIEDLSRKLGYHRTHLSKMFKQVTGVSPMQFLLKVRMERARELLVGQHYLSIDQIASSVGYLDALYFSKQFRKTYGLAPSEYRTRHRKEHHSVQQ
ncbi:AraC family transcriptional regulator [Paenibacillus nasutitermitis]|uniref:AraC family transcriptional regulator n=1 Tax=Paenibacillus nasutitermitis TaxID=1652958 RepID=A0A916YNT7_9BACL|nr:AraC family transcriptional regulator [Paenibacillus nasutitermitis]GGD54228.1 AraC family transcriptional regulator [Paenibacillus nasutitermitis]